MNVRRNGAVSATVMTALTMALGLGLAGTAASGWAERFGLDVWNLSELRATARTIDVEKVSLDNRRETLQREIELGGRVAARLVAGTCTLREAVDVLEPVLRNRVGFDHFWEFQMRTPTLRHGVANGWLGQSVRRSEKTGSM